MYLLFQNTFPLIIYQNNVSKYLFECWQAEGALYCVKENEDALLTSRKFKNEYAFREYNFDGCFITEQLPFSFIMEAICIFFTFFH